MQSNYEVETCSKCENQRYLVNRTHSLCENCNCIRLHGVSSFELARKKKQEQIDRQKEKAKLQPPKKRIEYFSKKGKVVHDALTEVKKQTRKEAIDSDSYYCQGCGVGGGLDCSHIISVAQRPDLQLDRENINLLCRSCHGDWESGDIEKMMKLHSFRKDMEYILKNDNTRFEKIMTKIEIFEAI